MLRRLLLLAALLAAAILAGCATPPLQTPPPTATLTASPTATLTPTITPIPTATSTRTPEPLLPTPLPTAIQTAAPAATTEAITDPAPTPASEAGAGARRAGRGRVGVGVPVGEITYYDWGDGLPGWYLNWRVELHPRRPGEIQFAQMVRIFTGEYRPDLESIRAIAAENPGSLWLIGNEPDVAWQDNSTPEQYASAYGALYPAIKEADPAAQIAIGGISQPTPLRLEYIERILAAYETQFGEPMPVDVWNIHAFILREERDSWGVGIPPGMDVNQGALYEIADHADMEIFRQQIVDFRRWMAEKGFRDKPLLVSEYGVLMPESYGFPPDVVSQFMLDTFDYFLTARDPELGYPADENRLVQAFCWYSVADTVYPTPNLFDPATKAVIPLGEIFRAYVAGLP